MVKKAIFPNLKKKVNLFLIINAFFMIPCCALAETGIDFSLKWQFGRSLYEYSGITELPAYVCQQT